MERITISPKFNLFILALITVVLALLACAPVRVGTLPDKTSLITSYDAAVSHWKSHEDLVKWLEKDFFLDVDRYKKFEGTLPLPRTPDETLHLKSGIYIDVAIFSKETLNRINPSYKAQVAVFIMRASRFNHYVCVFRKDGKLFIIDYGTPYRQVTGVHGPYSSLEDYKAFYVKHHPLKRSVEGIRYLP
jgi:hypothetical protein